MSGPRPLDPKYQSLLEEGVLPLRPRSKQPVPSATFGLVLHMVWRDCTATDVISSLLYDAANQAGDCFRAMPLSKARREIYNLVQKAEQKVAAAKAANDPHLVTETLTNRRAELLDQVTGPTRFRDRVVLDAVITLAIQKRTYEPAVSSRTLAAACGQSQTLVVRALERLDTRHEVLRRHCDPVQGTVLELNRFPKPTHSVAWAAPGNRVSRFGNRSEQVTQVEFPPLHPLWSNLGLGPLAGLVWAALAEPLSVAELVAATGASKSSVYRVLGLLEEKGLTERYGTVRARTGRSLDEVAGVRVIAGRLDSRIRRYRDESKAWRRAVDEIAARRDLNARQRARHVAGLRRENDDRRSRSRAHVTAQTRKLLAVAL